MSRFRTIALLSFFLAVALAAPPARALPGFFAGQDDKKLVSRSTHVAIMKRGETTVFTVMPDYHGPIRPFAFVMPVPEDVELSRIKTLRRDFIERLDQVTAPRFHEFWEMDPCEPGKAQQIWEQDLTAKATTDFLGMGTGGGGEEPKFKVEKEMRLTVEAEFKDGEHAFHLLSPGDAGEVIRWLAKKGYEAPAGAAQELSRYLTEGMKVLVAEINHNKIELAGSDRALLSPIRFHTERTFELPSRLGLMNLEDKQELYVYVLHPERRFEIAGYENIVPPTNLRVDFKVKERMGEFYAGLHDLILEKHPKSFLVEYAWTTSECGQPCVTSPLLVHELLSLGGDVFEESVPAEEKNPKPPELTEEEKTKLDSIEDKEEKKRILEMRTETARRKALIGRHAYVLTRLHHRYDGNTLPTDVDVAPAPHLRGGVGLPEGPEGRLPTEAVPADTSTLQLRYNFFHPNKAVLKCDQPVRWRWGKPPRTYRGLRKIWIAQDMATRSRTSIKPAEMVMTQVASLGLSGAALAPSGDAGAGDGGDTAKPEKKSSCGCRAPGSGAPAGGAGLAALAVLAAVFLRRAAGQRSAVRSSPRGCVMPR